MTLTTGKRRQRTLRRSVPVWGSDSAREVLVPEVLVPEVLVPEVSAPEVLAPEVLAPEVLAREVLALLAEAALRLCLRSAWCWCHWCDSHSQ